MLHCQVKVTTGGAAGVAAGVHVVRSNTSLCGGTIIMNSHRQKVSARSQTAAQTLCILTVDTQGSNRQAGGLNPTGVFVLLFKGTQEVTSQTSTQTVYFVSHPHPLAMAPPLYVP